jgi:hypothetical protein
MKQSFSWLIKGKKKEWDWAGDECIKYWFRLTKKREQNSTNYESIGWSSSNAISGSIAGFHYVWVIDLIKLKKENKHE